MKFRSPLRGPWLTSVLGVVLLAALPVVIVTGLLDYVATFVAAASSVVQAYVSTFLA